jgi:hypothetical protein
MSGAIEHPNTARVQAKNGRSAAISNPLRFTLGDFVFGSYCAVIARQFLWGLPSSSAAWLLSTLTAIATALFFARNRHPINPPRASFWLITGIPLLVMYVNRFMMPDFTFDVLNYHLVNGERALAGFPWMLGDLFPAILLVNPGPDMVFTITRHLPGYRLGTLPNVLAALWAACIAERLTELIERGSTFRNGRGSDPRRVSSSFVARSYSLTEGKSRLRECQPSARACPGPRARTENPDNQTGEAGSIREADRAASEPEWQPA